MGEETYTVERSREIAAPPERIFAALADFHQWRHWSPWEDIDPDLQRTYEGAESGVGAAYAWAGNRKAGTGRMEVTDAEAPHRLVIDLQFLKPFKSRSEARFTLGPGEDGTRVTWTVTGPKTFMTKVMGIFKSMDAMIGPDFEKGLAQLDEHIAA
jgi:uncharacterized protein YndB with AHSA1/START domain